MGVGGRRARGRDRVVDLSMNFAPHEAAARRFLSTPTVKRDLEMLDGVRLFAGAQLRTCKSRFKSN
jgi:hypothetical protein